MLRSDDEPLHPRAMTLRPPRREAPSDVLRDDLLAAAIITILLIPQSLAYALLAGLPPQVGLYASFLPLIAYALLGTSQVMAVGPAAVPSLMTAQMLGAVLPQFPGVAPEAAALVLAAEVGLLLAAAALLRLDALTALLSMPVLQGFVAGACLSIVATQAPVLVGSSARGTSLPEVLQRWWQAELPWQGWTAAFGLAALAALLLVRWRGRRWLGRWLPPVQAALLTKMAPLAVVGLAIAASLAWEVAQHGVRTVGALPRIGLPLAWPLTDPALWRALLPSAGVLALVTAVESLAVAESLGLKRGERIVPRRELAGLAAANLAAAVSSGQPVAGGLSRSAVAFDAGTRTRWAGLYVALMMAVAALVLAGPLAALPRAVLAAIIGLAAWSLIDWRPFRQAWHYDRGEFAVMAGVAALTLLVNVEKALVVGVAVSIALLLKRTARPHVARIGRVPGTEHYRNVDRHQVECTPGVLALRIDESLLFTNARQLPSEVVPQLQPDTRRVVLLMSPVNTIDFSGLEALEALDALLAERAIALDLAEIKGPVQDRLQTLGWPQHFRGRIFLSLHQAMQAGPAAAD